jgi:hypothetical protein
MSNLVQQKSTCYLTVEGFAGTPDGFDTSSDIREQKGAEKMSTLSTTQITLLLFFLGSERKLDPIRIMKGLFIFTMEAPELWLPRESRYHFVAYSYGPYSRGVDFDLNRLTLQGYLRQSQAAGKSWNYYSLTEAGEKKATEIAGSFPPAAVTYLKSIREFVQGLGFRRLLDTIYAKYPEYAVNSVFKS